MQRPGDGKACVIFKLKQQQKETSVFRWHGSVAVGRRSRISVERPEGAEHLS